MSKAAIARSGAKMSKATQTRFDTIEISQADVTKWKWKHGRFQRPIRVTPKVLALGDKYKAEATGHPPTAVLPGVITIGICDGDEYIVDGQHRLKAYQISGVPLALADVRYLVFESIDDMGAEWVMLNRKLANDRPDDILRGLEGQSVALQTIRKRCPFVGYDNVRRGPKSPIVSMSVLLRCWYASGAETPSAAGPSASDVAQTLTIGDAAGVIDFALLAEAAWGRDEEYRRLWGKLTMTLCMWIYRRHVQADDARPPISPELFRAGLSALSAESKFLEWLVGRQLNEAMRAPAWRRIKEIMESRWRADTGRTRTHNLPKPDWDAPAR